MHAERRGKGKKKRKVASSEEQEERSKLTFMEYIAQKKQETLAAEELIRELDQAELEELSAEVKEVSMSSASTWKIKNNDSYFTYFFEIDGDKLSGTGIAESDDSIKIILGSYKDKKVEWNEYASDNPEKKLGSFEALITEDCKSLIGRGKLGEGAEIN